MSDVVEELALATVDAVRRSDGTADSVLADLSSEEEVRALIDQTVATHGRLDGAFNNAGIEQCAVPLHELTTEQWERAIRVDLTSVFWCLKYQVIAMLGTGGGSIVNTASSLGQVAIPNASEYVAAKHGVMGLTRAAAAEYGRHGIRVNAILPGIIMTPMITRITEDERFRAFFEKLKDRHPIGRFGEPSEIGEAVKWLLSDAASFMNGRSNGLRRRLPCGLTEHQCYVTSKTSKASPSARPTEFWGHVRDFYFDDDAWVIRYFVVETGAAAASRRTLISPMANGDA